MKKLFILFTSLSLIGCASMFNNDVQHIQVFTKDNVKIKAKIDTPQITYETELPTVIAAEPSSFADLTIYLIDPCYPRYQYLAKKNIDSSYFANILNGHGFYIDYLNGNMWTYQQQLHIPIGLSDKAENCHSKISEITAASQPSSTQTTIKTTPRHHALFLGMAFTLENSPNLYGGKIGYQYHISERFFFSLQRSDFLDYRRSWDMDIKTRHHSDSISLNYHPKPGSSLYFGFGLAKSEISQSRDGYYYYNDTPDLHYSEERSPAFLNIGLQNAKNKTFFFNVNASIDLKDFHLDSFSRNKESNQAWQNLPENLKTKAREDLENVRSYSHLSMDFGFRF